MNESPATAVIETQQSPTTITITLHPQPNERENLCDNNNSSTITTAVELTNMSPTSCDSDSMQSTETAAIKRSLKLDLTHNNNKDESLEKDDLSFKSPTSPKSPRGKRIEHAFKALFVVLLLVHPLLLVKRKIFTL